MLFKRSKGTEIKSRRENKKPISAHPVFVPTLTLWGAAVAGLGVFVMPQGLTARIAQMIPFAIPAGLAHIAVAAIAAAIGAACMYLIAMAVRRSAGGNEGESLDTDVLTIDPAQELGSESLDAPIETDEQGFDEGYNPDGLDDFEPDWVEDQVDTATEEDPLDFDNDEQAEPLLATKPVKEERPTTHKIAMIQKLNGDLVRKEDALDSIASDFLESDSHADGGELDLGQFGDAPLEAPVVPQANKPEPVAKTTAPKSETAIEKLRSVPPQELSVVQMIERLAVAIHHRKSEGAKDLSIKQRDAQLAETLKTLGQFTEEGFDSEAAPPADGDVTEREMREALAKLREVRGAA